MYTDFTIKNFRIFDEEGTIVPLRPVTILTGCNNTGKSSIVKALCLLKDFCQQIENDYNDGKTLHLDRYKMDFQKSPNNIMGGFDLVRHHSSSTNNDNKHIIFELVVESSWLLQDVILHHGIRYPYYLFLCMSFIFNDLIVFNRHNFNKF